jgi:hypothetical protein
MSNNTKGNKRTLILLILFLILILAGYFIFFYKSKPIEISVAHNNPSFCQRDDGRISILVNSSDDGITYSIDKGENWQSDSIFTNLKIGTYNIYANIDGEVFEYLNNPVELAIEKGDKQLLINEVVVDEKNRDINIIASGGCGTINYSFDGMKTTTTKNNLSNLPKNVDLLIAVCDNFDTIFYADTIKFIVEDKPTINLRRIANDFFKIITNPKNSLKIKEDAGSDFINRYCQNHEIPVIVNRKSGETNYTLMDYINHLMILNNNSKVYVSTALPNGKK